MTITFSEDNIDILEGDTYIVGWNQHEWTEDPSIVFSIAEAIELAYTDPQKLKDLLWHNKIDN